MLLSEKVALVTGGTSGIGRAAARRLAQAGARVVLAGRRVVEGRAIVDDIARDGGDAHFVQTDIAQESQVQRLVAETLGRYWRLDVAFNNAGVEFAGPLTGLSEADYRRVFDVNVLGVLWSLKYEVPALLQSGGGSIINTSSVAGHVGLAGVSLYVASKHAVEGLTKAAALELAAQRIRVNAIAPGAIETEMIDRFAGPAGSERRAGLTSLHPLGRMGRDVEIADAVVFLASEQASFITGASLPVDGGWLAK